MTAVTVTYAPGVVTSNPATLVQPAFWSNGFVRIRLFYTGSAASTNNIAWKVTATAFAVGDLVTGVGQNQLVATEYLPGPAAVNKLVQADFTARLPVNAVSSEVQVVLERTGTDAADTYAGTVTLVGVLLTYQPSRVTN